VIHSKIETFDDLRETIGAFIQKERDNPFALQQLAQYFVGAAVGITKQTEEEKPEEKLEEGVPNG
jgi:hypothetical protein